MMELTPERVEQIVYKETPKTEVLPTILRSVYLRYMRLYEDYFADIDALNDEKIAELKKYQAETKSLFKWFYMDIPQEVCWKLETFDETYTSKLLGADWHKIVTDGYKEFKAEDENKYKGEVALKAAFSEACLNAFYDQMEDVFREGFGTASKAKENIVNGLASLLFGGKKE
ncbi:MAG: hypothetical protein IJ646_02210 [Clostridia bacterium]|nr:hypothetical protein [Clostridia bacterium]